MKFSNFKTIKTIAKGFSNFPLPSKPEGNPSVSSPIGGITHEMTKWGCLLCVFVVNHAVNPIMNLNWGMIYRWVYLKNKSWKGCLWVISDPILVSCFVTGPNTQSAFSSTLGCIPLWREGAAQLDDSCWFQTVFIVHVYRGWFIIQLPHSCCS